MEKRLISSEECSQEYMRLKRERIQAREEIAALRAKLCRTCTDLRYAADGILKSPETHSLDAEMFLKETELVPMLLANYQRAVMLQGERDANIASFGVD